LLYVNVLPYVCRIHRGPAWVIQYLPRGDHLVFGLLFFGAFASLPAIPMIIAFSLRKRVPVAFVASVIVATALLIFWHHDYDVSADAQAAIGLMVIPICAFTLTSTATAIVGAIEWALRNCFGSARR
jgi:hypothetical protein